MAAAPPEIVWENSVSLFLDQLVEADIRYFDVMEAIERIIHRGLHARTSTAFEFEGFPLRLHRVPSLRPGLRSLYVVTISVADGTINVIYATFSA